MSSTRRVFLKELSSLAAAGLPFLWGCHKPDDDTVTPPGAGAAAARASKNVAAVSLSALQAGLYNDGKERDSARTVPGPNQLLGFVRSEDGDIILFGFSDPERPPVEVDALAVALRNAYEVEKTYEGDPGCTIDPREGDDSWKLQDVRVFAMPHNCRVAARHVKLDAELKWAGAGIRSQSDLPIESAFDILRKRSPICGGSDGSRGVFYHRFWFYPLQASTPRFTRCRQNVRILIPVGVQLLTEQEFRDQQGRRVGATEASADAQTFSAQVTRLLGSTQVWRYMELVNDFRIIEVARLMRFVEIEDARLKYFLEEHRLDSIDVPQVLPGVEREEHGSATCEATSKRVAQGVEFSQRTENYQHTYRGGVEARVVVDGPAFAPKESCDLIGVRDSIMAARPNIRSVSWTVPQAALAKV